MYTATSCDVIVLSYSPPVASVCTTDKGITCPPKLPAQECAVGALNKVLFVLVITGDHEVGLFACIGV